MIRAGQQAFVGADIDAGPKFEPRGLTFDQTISDVGGVLEVRHAETLFQSELVRSVCEDGQTVFQAKALQEWADGIGMGCLAQVVGGQTI